MVRNYLTILGAAAAFLHSSVASAQDLADGATRTVEFVSDVRPLLEKHCWSCHGSEKQESGLRLDRRESLLAGGDLGPAVVLNNSAASQLIHYVSGIDPEKVMPPQGDRLSAEDIGVLKAWIDQGCLWPDPASGTGTTDQHWAYQPLRVSPPADRPVDCAMNPIDQFILVELEKRGILPAPGADRYTLIRRLHLDLIGLLPSVAEVDAFVNDARPDAYEFLVDHLLSSPHFGERWGRHWLDMARYADSDGYEKDNARPDAYRWRDWVIDAINADLPFDQFSIEQLAGDLLPDATPLQRLATAFHRQTLTNTEGGTDQEQFRVEACFDRTETTGVVWLGLTVGCARCHSHKYDAISQREYYQLFSVFNNADEQTTVIPKSAEEVAAYPAARATYDARVSDLTSRLQVEQRNREPAFAEWQKRAARDPAVALPDNIRQALAVPSAQRDDTQRQELLEHFSRQESPTRELLAELDELKKAEPPKPELTVRVIAQRTVEPRKTFVLKRGEFLQPITNLEVQPAALAVLPRLIPRSTDGTADRLDLARWLVDAENPLTSRVTVNHIWRLLFGSGLVRTSNDFGVRGERPTHPELLDRLAAWFIGRSGTPAGDQNSQPWSRKSLIKQIVMSATYRQSSKHRRELIDADPQNLLLARQNRLRVEGEIVRDLTLDVAGLLSRKIGGPSVYPPLPPGIAELSYAGNFKWTVSTGEDRYRRGMYTFFKRTSPHPNLITFDCPDANITCVSRQTSNTPLQALTSLNNETFAESSRFLAKRVLNLPLADDETRLKHAFRLCVARPPDPVELDELARLLQDSRVWYHSNQEQAQQLIGADAAADSPLDTNAAWIAVSRILLNLDEFISRE